VNLSKLDERNLIMENTYKEVSIFNFWNRGLQGVLPDEPIMTQIILFCRAHVAQVYARDQVDVRLSCSYDARKRLDCIFIY
jgi:hypothetical protein